MKDFYMEETTMADAVLKNLDRMSNEVFKILANNGADKSGSVPILNPITRPAEVAQQIRETARPKTEFITPFPDQGRIPSAVEDRRGGQVNSVA
jgi:hypothetical protein